MKVLCISSSGGHWIQLQRIFTKLNFSDVRICSTYNHIEDDFSGFKYYQVTDFSRDDLYKIAKVFTEVVSIERNFSPDLIITTGAAPGLVACLFWSILRRKTIWVDSIANSEKVSMSGRIAKYFCSEVLTQWKHLESGKVRYVGRIL